MSHFFFSLYKRRGVYYIDALVAINFYETRLFHYVYLTNHLNLCSKELDYSVTSGKLEEEER